MKKVFIMAIAVAAMTFTSCCNNCKTNAPKANADSATTEAVAGDSTVTAEAPAHQPAHRATQRESKG